MMDGICIDVWTLFEMKPVKHLSCHLENKTRMKNDWSTSLAGLEDEYLTSPFSLLMFSPLPVLLREY